MQNKEDAAFAASVLFVAYKPPGHLHDVTFYIIIISSSSSGGDSGSTGRTRFNH